MTNKQQTGRAVQVRGFYRVMLHDVKRGRKLYSENCVGCHGSEYQGTDQGPALKGSERIPP